MSNPIAVVELDGALEERYSEFVRRDPASMIYGTLEFKAFLQQVVAGTPRYLVALRGDRIAGVLPMFACRHETWGTVINSLPWFGSHGGCLVDPADGEAVRRALLARYAEIAGAADVSFASMVLTPAESRHLSEYLASVSPVARDERIGQVTTLPEDGAGLEQRLEQVCRQKTRNLVRKALKQGFAHEVADTDDAWQFLYQTHVDNMAAINGKAKPLEHFQAMRERIPAAWRQLVVTRLGDSPVAAMLLFRFNRTVEYITPVIRHDYRSMQPLSFAIWHAMLDAVRHGYRWWNWGGTWSSQVSLHHFKEGWGAEDRRYCYVINARTDARQALAHDRSSIMNAFPYYYIFPLAGLD